MIFSLFFIISRDAALFVIIFNKMDLFLPYLSFLEFISMLGLWPYERLFLKEFYTIIFTSQLDIFNLIRSLFSSENLTSSNSTLKDYQYTDFFLYNMSGELLILGILLFITMIIKSVSALSNF